MTNESMLNRKIAFLSQEMDHLKNGIYKYDDILFKVKGWSVTIFTAMIALSLKEGNWHISLISILPIILFWSMDALYKSFQRKFIVRANKIEHYIRVEFEKEYEAGKINLKIPDCGARVSVKDANDKTSPLKAAFMPYTAILYFLKIMFSSIVCVYLYLNS